MTVHDFEKQLGYSHSQSDASYWPEVYRQAFPDMVHSLDLRHDGWHQRAGRDRAIILASGRSVFIDEKVRREAYPDIAVEVWSTYPKDGRPPYSPAPGAKPGWGVKPLDCDFLAYAFESSCTCYLFPFLGVRAAWAKHARMWIDKATEKEDGYRWIVARNQRYDTISIAVPISILQACVNDALTVCWGALCPGSAWTTVSTATRSGYQYRSRRWVCGQWPGRGRAPISPMGSCQTTCSRCCPRTRPSWRESSSHLGCGSAAGEATSSTTGTITSPPRRLWKTRGRTHENACGNYESKGQSRDGYAEVRPNIKRTSPEVRLPLPSPTYCRYRNGASFRSYI